MFKKIVFSISILFCFANASQVNLSLPDAVSVNHKLIKDLYLRVETMDKKTGEKWGTVGVSENIIKASWEALIDSLEYYLNKKI